ncbi:carbohydrate ABC transporter permease [Paenibacillus aurantius]|uniref:Carbohydrate ABC transporter permease n=1 Tax=Paenibacillus aurantius TaxID=2918900 RepID=A0AA96LKM0_9BACL|nr:carbohydrate ABC transporter permease [Paenibacillus aurantius]WNQ13127.1 carbohydrate ABC transporter permease [Paenibacillus aurantius]
MILSVLIGKAWNKLPFRRRSRLNGTDGFQWVLYVLLTLASLFMLLPLFYIFNHSLKPYNELFVYPPNVFVRKPTLQNFVELFAVTGSSVVPVSRYFFNSVVVSVMVVVGTIVVSALCAYPISKHRFPGQRTLFAVILLSLMYAPETVAIPRYLVMVNLHMINTYWAHVLPNLAAPVGVFLMKQFIDQVPNELLEAAKIDGAKEWQIFLRVVIPICMPAVATISILAFQGIWSSTEASALFMQEETMKTFPFFLTTLTNGLANSVARQGAAAAAALIMFLPNFIIFLFFQRKVITTMAHSGIK